MSWETYEDACPGCKPAMLNLATGARLPDDSPEMKLILAIFDKLTLPERQAWHRFTCMNSRASGDLEVISRFQGQIQAALTALEGFKN